MGKVLIGMVGVFVVFLVLAVVLVLGFVGFQNNCNGYEIGIQKQDEQNSNVYDNGWKKVKEVSQVPNMEAENIKRVYDDVMKGRYGAEGSKALFQAIAEQNPQLSQSLYVKIQQVVEEFRNSFQQSQKELVARKEAYEMFLRTNTSSRIYNTFAGYPKIDLSKYKVITSETTDKVFDTRRDDKPLDLAPANK